MRHRFLLLVPALSMVVASIPLGQLPVVGKVFGSGAARADTIPAPPGPPPGPPTPPTPPPTPPTPPPSDPTPAPKQQQTQQSAGKHHASSLQKFGIATGVCVGVSAGSVLVFKKRLPHSREWARITVQCVIIGAASLNPVLGPVVVAIVLIDNLFLDGALLGPIINPLADIIEPIFRQLDPSFWQQKKVKKQSKQKQKKKFHVKKKPKLIPVS